MAEQREVLKRKVVDIKKSRNAVLYRPVQHTSLPGRFSQYQKIEMVQKGNHDNKKEENGTYDNNPERKRTRGER